MLDVDPELRDPVLILGFFLKDDMICSELPALRKLFRRVLKFLVELEFPMIIQCWLYMYFFSFWENVVYVYSRLSLRTDWIKTNLLPVKRDFSGFRLLTYISQICSGLRSSEYAARPRRLEYFPSGDSRRSDRLDMIREKRAWAKIWEKQFINIKYVHTYVCKKTCFQASPNCLY